MKNIVYFLGILQPAFGTTYQFKILNKNRGLAISVKPSFFEWDTFGLLFFDEIQILGEKISLSNSIFGSDPSSRDYFLPCKNFKALYHPNPCFKSVIFFKS